MRHVIGKRIYSGAHVLRGRVGHELVEASQVRAGKTTHGTIVVHADEDSPARSIAEGNDLGCQGIGIVHVGLELMATILASAEELQSALRFP